MMAQSVPWLTWSVGGTRQTLADMAQGEDGPLCPSWGVCCVSRVRGNGNDGDDDADLDILVAEGLLELVHCLQHFFESQKSIAGNLQNTCRTYVKAHS